MSYRSMMVCLDDSARAQERLDFAIGLALDSEAHLTGVHLSYMPLASYMAYDGAEPAYAQLEQDLLRRQQDAHAAFAAATRRAGLDATDWVAARSEALDSVAALARGQDLVIAGQRDPEDATTWIGEGFPGRFLLETARPVLMTPCTGPLQPEFERIAVAWNGSRESARAVADALPLLRRAGQVMVLMVVPPTLRHEEPKSVPRPDIMAWLHRHGVRAELVEDIGSDDAGEWMLARLAEDDLQADLLVAGAYGHSRLSEIILGGVTRTLLRDMTLPILFSH
jgi:nucleotide-binding universal stress UspA family protein